MNQAKEKTSTSAESFDADKLLALEQRLMPSARRQAAQSVSRLLWRIGQHLELKIKRLLDIVVSLSALLVLSPLF
ncbi:MAG: hypothetical protein ACO21E_12270, partial [Hylemonella sp.]